MTTLTERLNIVAGNVSSELSFEIIIANKKNMVVSDFVSVINDFLDDELSEQELNDAANVIMDFSTAEDLPFGGEVSIWFDAKVNS